MNAYSTGKNRGEIIKVNDNFSPFDLKMADFLASLDGKNDPSVRLAAQLLCRQMREGHVCLNLRKQAGRSWGDGDALEQSIQAPELSDWRNALLHAGCVGFPGEFKPLLLDHRDRLYFQRYWQYERDIAAFILQRVESCGTLCENPEAIRNLLQKYFPDAKGDAVWQAVAAVAALLRNFLVITGSPGTGKTTTITKIMAFLMEVRGVYPRIALCAPTGKAAVRLEEAVGAVKKTLPVSEVILNAIPNEAMTIHRLLGSIRYSPFFRFNDKNPLPYDIVVADEFSMADLPLAAKLFTALSPGAQLFLLGDKDQLASVETGAVLGNICCFETLNVFSQAYGHKLFQLFDTPLKTAQGPPGVSDGIIALKKNYRFSSASGIGLMSEAIRDGNVQQVRQVIESGAYPDIAFVDLDRIHTARTLFESRVMPHYQSYQQAIANPDRNEEEIFNLFDAMRILCALRVGPWGTEKINALMEKIFYEKGWFDTSQPFYEGRPVMIIQNDYRLNLFNGDVGLTLKDPADAHKLRVCFRDRKGIFRNLSPERLPRHETVWAMTVLLISFAIYTYINKYWFNGQKLYNYSLRCQ